MVKAESRQMPSGRIRACKRGTRQPGESSDLLLENRVCKNYISVNISRYAKIKFIDSKMHFSSFTFNISEKEMHLTIDSIIKDCVSLIGRGFFL